MPSIYEAMHIEVNGLRVHYALEGRATAPVLTLCHCLAANLSMWEPQLDAFSSRYRVLRYDLRGHGQTDPTPGRYSLDLLADDLLALLDALDIDRTHFVGLSLSGMIGLALAVKAPQRVTGLVACNCMSQVSPQARPQWLQRIATVEAQGVAPMVEFMLGRWFTEGFRARRPETVKRIGDMIASTSAEGYLGGCHAIVGSNLADRIATISAPTLVVAGEKDPATPLAVARHIHEQINGSRLAVIENAAHLANVEQPQAFTELVLEFLGMLSDADAKGGALFSSGS